ncbi:hypothetical protein OVA13_04480 [Pseudoxanthomonas sp. SL93]|jgi:hypothetical protein|uniref:hypothetical protein n=1 Tax=Pseudoxanthomonas sp. SL93 TaxID=2995142 RepID=UPI00226E0EC7|nr:hypothetical protein [Pseudoxanthomonas sp. SL93]WAC64044.1 hypothetical protein OVA13_04480 [Pseudoxanthomonas sp. SL93]
MRWITRWPLILLGLSIGIANAWPADASAGPELSREYGDFMEVHEQTRGLTTAQRASAILDSFENNFANYSTRDPSELGDQDLLTLFRAANIAHAYSISRKALQVMMQTFEALSTRDLVSQRTYGDMHGALVASRDIAQARGLEDRFPLFAVERMPDIAFDSISGATAIAVPASGSTLRRVELKVNNGPRIIVISHPLCHFSRDAIAAIEADGDLSIVMLNSIWIAPVDRQLYIDVLREWNIEHEKHPMVIAFDRAELPALDSWSTPTFYFLKDGRVVSVVEGWPSEGRKREIIAAARSIGL